MNPFFSFWNKLKYLLWLLMLVMFALSLRTILRMLSESNPNLHMQDTVCLAIECFTIGIMCLMFFGNLLRKNFRKLNIYFSLLVFMMSLYLLCDSEVIYWDGCYDRISVLWFLNTLIYIGGILLYMVFWLLLKEWLEEADRFTVWDLIIAADTVLGLLPILSNNITKWYFYMDAGGFYRNGSLNGLSLLSPAVFTAVIVLKVLVSSMDLSEKLIFMTFPVFPLVSACLTAGSDGSTFLGISCFVSVFFIYCNLFTQKERKLEENIRVLQEKATAVMISQIQPHFLYNTLSVIAYLCAHDPGQARETIIRFSDYLRMNMDSLRGEQLVPFTKELEHTRTYLSIEKLRFGDILNVEYDIRCTDFTVPVLSLQPLVENAVKHGIRGNEDGGTVKISSWEENGEVTVTVEDDGIGFDPGQIPSSDGRSHVGLENSRERIQTVGKGTFSLYSEIGKGTKITIVFPAAPDHVLKRKRGLEDEYITGG